MVDPPPSSAVDRAAAAPPAPVTAQPRLAAAGLTPAKAGLRLRRRAAQRGFTMVEMLTVIIVILVLAASAAPSFVRLMRDKRVNAAAIEIADIYRVARARAMGRGSAVVIRWNQTALPPTDALPEGHFTMREATTDLSTGPALPSSSCFAADWTTGSNTSRRVRNFDERRVQYNPAAASFVSYDGTVRSYAEVCFTPRGRTFIRYDPSSTFIPMAGVPRVEVVNLSTQLHRRVLIPPSGVARVITTL